MNILPEVVKELREKTGAGMMDCKRALVESGGSIDKALEALRKQGLAIAAKKSSRVASEGLIGSSDSGNSITMVEINCETDFVCKTDDFQNFVKTVTGHIAETQPKDIDALLTSAVNGKKVSDTITDLVAKIGENIGVRRFSSRSVDGKATKKSCYVHAGSKIGVIVLFDDPADKLTDAAAKDVAMHVAAMSPQYIRKTDIPEAVLSKEREICMAQTAKEKKPPEIMEKIVAGKLNKYLSEICLEDQIFVRDPVGKQSVAQMLKTVDPAIKIKEFIRYQVGEGIEKNG